MTAGDVTGAPVSGPESGPLYARRVRAARNQSLLREANARIEKLSAGEGSKFERLQQKTMIDLVCECSDDSCTEPLTLSVADYDGVRSGSIAFFMRPGHAVPAVEQVVREEKDFVVVTKVGVAVESVERHTPRRRRRRR